MQLLLGTANFKGNYGALPTPNRAKDGKELQEILSHARSRGFDGFDTAPVYGQAERQIGMIETALPVSTKLAINQDPIRSLDESLRKTRRDSLDVLYFHEELRFTDAQEEIIRRLSRFRGQKFSRLGASIYEERELDRMLNRREISAIQLPYNVLDQRFNRLRLSDAKARGLAIFGRSVLLQGLLVAEPGNFPPRLARLVEPVRSFQQICHDWNVTPVGAAVMFAKSNSALDGLIVGARSIKELDDLSSHFFRKPIAGLINQLNLLVTPPWPEIDPRTW